MPLELFRSPVFTGTNIVTVFLYGALAAFLFLMPFDLQARRGLTASETGLAVLPIGIVIGVFSRMTGGLADRIGPRPFLTIGPFLVGLGAAGLALNLANIWLGVIVPVLLISAGMAIVVSPLTTAVMNAVPDSRSGAASGVNNAASRLAGVLAIAIIGRSPRWSSRPRCRPARCSAYCRRRTTRRGRRRKARSSPPMRRPRDSRRCGASRRRSPPGCRCRREPARSRRNRNRAPPAGALEAGGGAVVARRGETSGEAGDLLEGEARIAREELVVVAVADIRFDFTLVPAKNSASTFSLLKPPIGPASRPRARSARMK
jgi:hypothetical protein